ncbi:MAG: 4Fe-4S ferredoxin iron-sulfur binding domain protein [Deltaproteobacteria bacterium]|nr:4Fe-4S ferredoxin iron-sulfur binding domain protein [Deltaproteobacteria bacterium]
MVVSAAKKEDMVRRLSLLFSDRLWGWVDHPPTSQVIENMLKENFNDEELQALSDIPLKPLPLEFVPLGEIAARSRFPRARLEKILDGIVARGLLFSGKTKEGEKGYAVLRMAFGFTQAFYWKGTMDAHARKMAELETDPLFIKAKLGMYTSLDTKPFRYIPMTEAIDPQWQNVYPTETIERVINDASRFAVAHCPCRVKYELVNGKGCGHSKDVCLKLDELADCLIDTGLAKEISREEALAVIKRADEEGLVHYTENTAEHIQTICNCCGCACWSVGPIRRRLVPRDLIMATYFLRLTSEEDCTGCGDCIEICPVDAVRMEDDVARVDLDWCIGCGVCISRCPTKAIRLVEKADKPRQTKDFAELFTKVTEERTSVVEARERPRKTQEKE